jgi:hypothetical protein
MAVATAVQMQTYGDERVRVRAEQVRDLINALKDDKLAIDSVYELAVSGTNWNDTRTDGPPKLLQKNDFLTYNSVATLLLKLLASTDVFSAQDVNDLRANLPVFFSATVRPV